MNLAAEFYVDTAHYRRCYCRDRDEGHRRESSGYLLD